MTHEEIIAMAKKALVTAERLRELLSYDPFTGVFAWRNAKGTARAGDKAGSVNGDGYVYIRIDGRMYGAHRLAWLYVHGEFPANQLDHLDRDRANNALCNLQSVTCLENNQNRGLQRNNKSGYRGVSWDSRDGRWRAQIRANGKKQSLGYFGSAEEAHIAYTTAATKLHSNNQQAIRARVQKGGA